MTDVYIVAGVRTAVGTFGGALKDISPSALDAHVAREAVARDPTYAAGHALLVCRDPIAR